MSKAVSTAFLTAQIQESKKIADLERLLEVAKAMTRTHDLDELLKFITQAAIDLAEADRCSIFLVDSRTNEMFGRVTSIELKEIRFPVGVGIAGAVAATGTPINIPDAYHDSRFNQAIDRQTGYRTTSLLTMPLKNYDNRVVGVIQLLNKKTGVPFSGYDESVLEAMGSIAAVALDTAQLLESYIEKQKIQSELQLARSIQEKLLPAAPPALPGYDLAGFSKSADETGGDYFDYFYLKDGRFCALVGDVSGHGVGAALLMTTARAFLKGLLVHDTNIERVVGDINNLLEQDSSSEKFMTMFLLVLNPATHEFQYISAGHDEPLMWKADAGKFLELESTGLPLGIMGNFAYEQSPTHRFAPGDMLFLSTDGIWEAPNRQNDRFGRDRLKMVLESQLHQTAGEIARVVVTSVQAFCDGARQADDLTVILIKRLPGA